jgi:hypothetical protein
VVRSGFAGLRRDILKVEGEFAAFLVGEFEVVGELVKICGFLFIATEFC